MKTKRKKTRDKVRQPAVVKPTATAVPAKLRLLSRQIWSGGFIGLGLIGFSVWPRVAIEPVVTDTPIEIRYVVKNDNPFLAMKEITAECWLDNVVFANGLTIQHTGSDGKAGLSSFQILRADETTILDCSGLGGSFPPLVEGQVHIDLKYRWLGILSLNKVSCFRAFAERSGFQWGPIACEKVGLER